jgi:hypothetical protein
MICHHVLLSSVPIICTLEKMDSVPSIVAPADGALRTLTCVVVVPSTGATVGATVGGTGVDVGGGVQVGGKVAVMMKSVGVAGTCGSTDRAHPLVRATSRAGRKLETYRAVLFGTVLLYPRTQK